MSDIFLSYARSTEAQAHVVAEALRALGYRVWRDDQLPAHRAYREVLQERIAAAKAVVVVWSAEAIKSEWVSSEANRGREAHKLVQLTVDGSPLPMPFDQIQSADLQGWNGATDSPGWRKVVASVAALMGGAESGAQIQAQNAPQQVHGQAASPALSASMSLPSAISSKVRRRWLPVALTSAVALASLAAYLLWPQAVDRLRASSPTTAAARAPATSNDAHGIPGFGGRPAIAVLPLENRSSDPAQAFLADGLADDLITRLSSWRSIPVIARSSSFRYRGNNVDVKRVASELGVRYVVEGSVRRAGDRIRIAVQLIDAETSANVWSETYDRDIVDMFAVQDEISSTIAASLMGGLMHAEGDRTRQRGTENLEAWGLVQLGMQRSRGNTLDDMAAAQVLVERAVALDPRFASAQAMLALFMIFSSSDEADARRRSAVARKALVIARRAVELDPRDAFAHSVLGSAYLAGGDVQNALDSFQRALDLNPSMTLTLREYGRANLFADKPVAAVASCKQALRLDPIGDQVPFAEMCLADAYWETGRYQAGLEAARRALAAMPGYWFAYVAVAQNAVALGRMDEARAAIAGARRVTPNLSLATVQDVVSRPEIDARRNAALRQAGLE